MESLRLQSSYSLTSVPSSSTSGSGGAISIETIINIFELIKVLGFVNVHNLCKFRQYSTDITLQEICATVQGKYGSSIEPPNVDWLNNLNEEGLIKVQNIISAVLEKKRTVLDAFKNGNDRNSEIDIIGIFDHVSLYMSRHIIARAGSFYLRENNFLKEDEEKEIFSYQDFFVCCKHELDWLNLSQLILNDLDFSDGNLTGTDLTNSNLCYTKLNGAAQEHMVVNGADLSRTKGFKVYSSTQFNDKTKIRGCSDIEIDIRPLADNNLAEILRLFSIYSHGVYYSPDYRDHNQQNNIGILLNGLLSSELPLSINSLSQDQRDLLFSLFASVAYNFIDSNPNNSPYLESLYQWLDKEILPKKIMAANSGPLNVRSNKELERLTNYVVSSKDKETLISQHRGFVVQLLCHVIKKGYKPYSRESISQGHFTTSIYSLYREYAPLFFDLCEWELVCPGLNQLGTPDGSLRDDAITWGRPDAPNTFKFEHLPVELQASIMNMMSVNDNLRFACTSKSKNQMVKEIYSNRLDWEHASAKLWVHFGVKVMINIWKNNPDFRQPAFLLSDTEGLLYAVRHNWAMGPRTIEKIRLGTLSWAQAKEERKKFDPRSSEEWWCIEGVDKTVQRYLLDGSISEHDATRELSKQEQRNISSRYVQTLIDCDKLTVQRALALTENQLKLLYSESLVDLIVFDKLKLDDLFKLEDVQIKHLHLYSYLVVREKISISTLLELLVKFPFLANDGWYQHYIYERKLELKEGIFLHCLKVKFENGGWEELKKVIKPQSDQLCLDLPDDVNMIK